MEIDTHGTLDSKDAPPDGFLYQDTRPKGFEFHHVYVTEALSCARQSMSPRVKRTEP
jgi:hypothetical protein